ncbi:hypothetical protein [Methanopyrus kandleri]|uniref:Uncharacterized membrane protein specific for M.kandleri, MK-15 family n=2 Tax=Methanopyrus kandleri TaxID=2320 RepID=Q8TWQ3_METKA|nr:hypothetical protein [Methanopyrus kandleri]AAM02192.1 Uncharacterized membrane protein specific for M.kandleri, MK-15 family [Methanopyrus kandleri AV19]HII69604.1 hypothetical protein [Methanopyrus kandleri]
MRWNLTVGVTALALILLVTALAPSYIPAACLLLEGGSRPKLVAFLGLLTAFSLGSAVVRKRPDPLITSLLLLVLPFTSNLLHCVAAKSIGVPPGSEFFVFNGRVLEGDSPLHTHIGKAALTWALERVCRISLYIHCGMSLVETYPTYVLAAEFVVVSLSVLLGVFNTRDPLSCLASSLLVLSSIDGGAFSLPYVHGSWLLALRYVREPELMIILLWFAALSPYCKLVLGTLLTHAYYGERWDSVRLQVLAGPLDGPLKSLGGVRCDGYYVLPVRSCAEWKEFLRNLEDSLRRSKVRWVAFCTFPNMAMYL